VAIERTRLTDEGLAAPGGSIVLIEAPAGFGKTFLLTQWHARAAAIRQTVAWISAHKEDCPRLSLKDLIAQALAACGIKHIASHAPRSDRNGPSGFARDLAVALRAQRRRVLLIIDDYHLIECDQTDVLVGDIARHMPPCLTVAIASRRMCRAPLSSAVLQGRVHRLDKRSLLFSKSDTRTFLGAAFAPEEKQGAQYLTEGWPAVLQFARVCLNDWRRLGGELRNVPSFVHLTREYFTTEILAALSEREIALLTDAAVVEDMDPDLCDALSGRTDSASTLAGLASRQTLLDPADLTVNQWRMPRLIKDFFHRRALEQGSAAIAAAHVRAAAHLECRQESLAAIPHYIAAGDQMGAAICLEKANPLRVAVCQGDERAAMFIDLISMDQLMRFPRLALCCAYLDFKRGLRRKAHALFESVAVRTQNFQCDRIDGDDMQLALEALYVELVRELYGCSRVSLDYLNSVEERISVLQSDVPLSALSYLLLGILYELRGDLEEAERYFSFSHTLHARYRLPWRDLWLKYHQGTLALARGKLMDARYHIQAGMRLWRGGYKTYATYGVLSELVLAEIDYESDDFAAAQARLDAAMYTAVNIEGLFEPYARAFSLAMMLHYHARRLAELDASLTRPPVGERIMGLLSRFIEVLRIRFQLLRGDFDTASRLAEERGLPERWAAPDFEDTFAHVEWDLAGVCLAQIRFRQNEFPAALDVAVRLERVARASGRLRTVAKALLLKAAIRFATGEDDAYSSLNEALVLGRKEGYRRTFMDEADLISPLLTAYCKRTGTQVREPIAGYAKSILQRMTAPDPEGAAKATDILSTREQEVLRELGLGYPNKVIARKLELSEATVKFHVKNIFRKLKVRKRAAVVIEAHRHGLLT
jgi:LuxR family maltose regulon positive regulatory protein